MLCALVHCAYILAIAPEGVLSGYYVILLIPYTLCAYSIFIGCIHTHVHVSKAAAEFFETSAFFLRAWEEAVPGGC